MAADTGSPVAAPLASAPLAAAPLAPTPHAPRPTDPVELQLARSAVLLLAILSVPTIGIAYLAAGADGALSAAIGAAVVIGMFLMTGSLMSWAARISPTAMLAAALGGYLVRLVIYAVLIIVLGPVEAIHGPTLAISAAVLLVIALGWEVRLVSKQPALFWVDPAAPKPRSAAVVQSPPFAAHGDPAGSGRTSHDSSATPPARLAPEAATPARLAPEATTTERTRP